MPGSASAIGRIKIVGGPQTSAGGSTVAAQAFGGDTSSGAPSPVSALHPGRPVGLRYWAGVGAFVALVVIYWRLPE